MTIEQYEDFVEERCQPYTDLNYCVVALNGEAGEFAEWHKKFNLRGDRSKLSSMDALHELGDCLFYITRAANLMGCSLGDIMDMNRDKLEARIATAQVVG